MRTFKHVGNTWIVAVLLHPFLFAVFFALFTGELACFILAFLVALLAGGLFSLPILLLAWWILPHIIRLPFPGQIRLFIWCLFLVTSCIMTTAALIGSINQWQFSKESILFPLPALTAITCAVLLRKAAFESLCQSTAVFYDPEEWNELISTTQNTPTNES